MFTEHSPSPRFDFCLSQSVDMYVRQPHSLARPERCPLAPRERRQGENLHVNDPQHFFEHKCELAITICSVDLGASGESTQFNLQTKFPHLIAGFLPFHNGAGADVLLLHDSRAELPAAGCHK